MRVQFSIVGTVERHDNVSADLEAVPRVGDTVSLPGVSEADTVVRTVVWHPVGDEDGGGPSVYVVLGQRRREWPTP